MRKAVVAGIFGVGLLAGCAGEVQEGRSVFITPSDSAHLSQCQMLGQVEVNAQIFGKWTITEQIAEIKNRFRDATAIKFPDADTVSHSDLNIGVWGRPDANVMGTAFKCFN